MSDGTSKQEQAIQLASQQIVDGKQREALKSLGSMVGGLLGGGPGSTAANLIADFLFDTATRRLVEADASLTEKEANAKLIAKHVTDAWTSIRKSETLYVEARIQQLGEEAREDFVQLARIVRDLHEDLNRQGAPSGDSVSLDARNSQGAIGILKGNAYQFYGSKASDVSEVSEVPDLSDVVIPWA